MSKPKKQTSTSPSKEKTEGNGSTPKLAKVESETGSVDKIRDILFGNQMRDYDKRFARTEERLLAQIDDLREETGKRLDSIEKFVKTEIESLSEQLKTEQGQQAESVRNLSKEIKENLRTVSKSIERLDEKQRQESKELRQQLLEQSKDLYNEIQKNKYQHIPN